MWWDRIKAWDMTWIGCLYTISCCVSNILIEAMRSTIWVNVATGEVYSCTKVWRTWVVSLGVSIVDRSSCLHFADCRDSKRSRKKWGFKAELFWGPETVDSSLVSECCSHRASKSKTWKSVRENCDRIGVWWFCLLVRQPSQKDLLSEQLHTNKRYQNETRFNMPASWFVRESLISTSTAKAIPRTRQVASVRNRLHLDLTGVFKGRRSPTRSSKNGPWNMMKQVTTCPASQIDSIRMPWR